MALLTCKKNLIDQTTYSFYEQIQGSEAVCRCSSK